MKSEPHPSLPGVIITTPFYVGSDQAVSKMIICDHQWPEGLPDRMQVEEGYLVGTQFCLFCGATRGIYKKHEQSHRNL